MRFAFSIILLAIFVLAGVSDSFSQNSNSRNLRKCLSDQRFKSADGWLVSLEKSENIDSAIRERIKAQGGTPLCWRDEIVFVALADGQVKPRIVGDFNDGGFASSDFVGDGMMKRVGTSQWFVLRARVSGNSRFEYLIRRGDKNETDQFNPVSVTTFGTRRSVFEGHEIKPFPKPTGKISRGTLEKFELVSKIRDNKRTVTVYLPPKYKPNGKRLPTLYVKDGTRFLKDADLPATVDLLISQNRLPPVIVVFVDSVNRGLEYGTSEKYRRLVVEELVPEVERRFSSGGNSRQRGLFGASRGGLAVVDLLLRHPETFGFTAAMSPALSPLPIIKEIESSENIKGSFLVLVSRYDNPALLKDGRNLAEVLKNRADEVVSIEMPIDHSVYGWKLWMEKVLLNWSDWSEKTALKK